jgi:hypothetical protein
MKETPEDPELRHELQNLTQVLSEIDDVRALNRGTRTTTV